ncbi:ribosomal protein L21-like protein [Podospora fimiseda]|uniref:Large ribosomal subunit protein bL21m n=1 Tax=Podospora fimiseda TaxID=252190 RepID=A0AAN7BXG8_9PEZI|nr:ribosomal protein L21-like protein [Podospora fimiseda]
MSRALLRSVMELRSAAFAVVRPSTTTTPLLRIASSSTPRFFTQTTQHVESTSPPPPPPSQQTPPPPPPTSSQPQQEPKPIDPSVRDFLPILAAQPGGHYMTLHIQGQQYLVTQGDIIRLPFKMPGVNPGDVLRLNRVSSIGSRDLTLKGSPYVDERLFECRAIVTGTESEPMRLKIKKKQRCRRKKTVKSKHRYTILTVSELKVLSSVPEGI